MERFRNFIKGNLDALVVSFVVAVTLLSATIGSLLGAAIATATKGGIEWAFIMFLAVGGAGLVTSVTVASIALTLAEIARHTGESIELLKRLNQSNVHRTLADGGTAAAGGPTHRIFLDVTKELTAQSLSILRTAKKEGYEVTIAPNKKSITVHKADDQHLLASNSQILLLGQSKGWPSE